MTRLLRMDASGHTELAAWSAGDSASHERAASIFKEQLDGGYMGVAKLHDESFEQVKTLPVDVELCCCAAPSSAASLAAGALPELESVGWRRRTDERSLRLRERISAAYTALYVTPVLVVGRG